MSVIPGFTDEESKGQRDGWDGSGSPFQTERGESQLILPSSCEAKRSHGERSMSLP